MRPSVPIPQCLRPRCLLYKFPPRATHIQGITWQDFWTELKQSRLVLSRNRVIFYHRSKRNNRTIKWYSEPPSTGRLPIRQEILNVSQIGVTFHGIRPPFHVQTWLQQYSRGAFLYFAHCSLSNPICLWSVWCRRTMIPGKIFTRFAKVCELSV